ncbi:MAG: bifunctional nuclease family protein [Lentisphaeria bacterium]|jgi:hypothetical protein
MMEADISHITLSNEGFVVILKLKGDPRSVPLFTGIPEAYGIALPLNKIRPPRPLTHDLLKHLLDVLECRLLRVEIHRPDLGSYLATLFLRHPDANFTMDCRPSDGLALAIRFHAPILVEDGIADECGILVNDGVDAGEDGDGDGDGLAGSDQPPPANRLSLLRRQMAAAVRREAYEEAARLRDEIWRETHPLER